MSVESLSSVMEVKTLRKGRVVSVMVHVNLRAQWNFEVKLVKCTSTERVQRQLDVVEQELRSASV